MAGTEIAPADSLTIGFRVTDTRLNALLLVAGDKGELGGMLDESDPVYRNFDLHRRPS